MPNPGGFQNPTQPANYQQNASKFGATGNGITDDTAALQAAIDATPNGGTLVLDDLSGFGTYLLSRPLNVLSSGWNTATGAKSIKITTGAERADLGVRFIATPTFGQNPMLNVSCKNVNGGVPAQFPPTSLNPNVTGAACELEGLTVDASNAPTATCIYYDRVTQVTETKCRTRGGQWGRSIGWCNNLTFNNPEAFNHSVSYWNWLNNYTTDAPWDTANAGNWIGYRPTNGAGGTIYSDGVTYKLLLPLNYSTSFVGLATAFFTMKAHNDFQILGGHSLRTPGSSGFVSYGWNCDFSLDASQKNLYLFSDMHEVDALWDGTGGQRGAGAALYLNNCHFARFGSNAWMGAYSAGDGPAEQWCATIVNSSDVVFAHGGHWAGRGVQFDGVNTDIAILSQFTQPLSDPVVSTIPNGTLDSTMNTLTLPRASIAVDMAASAILNLPTSGTILVTTGNGPQAVAFTGQSSAAGVTTFTGCTGGSGTMSTGGIVTLQTVTKSVVAPMYDGTLTDSPATLAGLVQGVNSAVQTPTTFVGNATGVALAIGRAMDSKTWSWRMDTSATGTLTLLNPEGANKWALSDAGIMTLAGAWLSSVAAITAAAGAATVGVSQQNAKVTNNAAAALAVTLTVAGANDGQLTMVRVYDFSAVAQNLTWVGTENSAVTPPATTTGVLNSPREVWFRFNAATSLWRCVLSV